MPEFADAAAYFNMDVAVSGSKFGASAVPSLKQFLRDLPRLFRLPKGGTVYESWQKANKMRPKRRNPQETSERHLSLAPAAQVPGDVPVGDFGSGSDYSVFLQHLGVPSSDIGSSGVVWRLPFRVRQFRLVQEVRRSRFSLRAADGSRLRTWKALRMADADVLPYDYEEYGKEILVYLDAAKNKARGRSSAIKLPTFPLRLTALIIWKRPAQKFCRSNGNFLPRPSA